MWKEKSRYNENSRKIEREPGHSRERCREAERIIIMSQTSDLIRSSWKVSDAERDAGLATPSDIIRCDDIVYGSEPKWQSLDVYRPKTGEDRKLPVIVSVHGGAWVYGDKELYQYYCMDLAQRGFAVVNFTYRLAPEHKFPAMIEDTNSVFAWVLANSDKYGFDLEHVFAVGDSAGAHNLGIYTCICTNPAYAAEYDFQPPVGFVPAAVALNCGVYDVEAEKSNPESTLIKLLGDFLPEAGSKKEFELLNVVSHLTEKFPPVFLMTAVDDFLKAQAPVFAAELVKKSIPFELHFYGDSHNKLGHVFHCNIRMEDAKKCNNEECEFFRQYL